MTVRAFFILLTAGLVVGLAGCGDAASVPQGVASSPARTPSDKPSLTPSPSLSPTPSSSPTPLVPSGNVVDLSCQDQHGTNRDLRIYPGPKGPPDFSEAWALKLTSCDVVNNFYENKVKPLSPLENAVYKASEGDDDDISFQYEECASVDPDDEATEPGFSVSEEDIPQMTATLKLCSNHPQAAKWRGALKRGQRDVTLEREGRIFDDGTYRVGKDIKPGTYITRDVAGCYWERQNRNGGTIDNYFVNGAKRVQVTIRSSDYGFHTEGCGTWHPA
ncbi:hypothetical protein [Micromonospora sp. NBC_00421]|uniref:hypothetical protein n=1 Tax=Micromonospora sp. NBC_00421 TaxID=2975976 RepID=UPI002E1F8587